MKNSMMLPGASEPKWIGTVTVEGTKNPVLAALQYFQLLNAVEVDEESFRAVADTVGDREAEGFLVEKMDDVQRLADIGGFYVIFDRGVIRACLNNNGQHPSGLEP